MKTMHMPTDVKASVAQIVVPNEKAKVCADTRLGYSFVTSCLNFKTFEHTSKAINIDYSVAEVYTCFHDFEDCKPGRYSRENASPLDPTP